MRGLLLLRGLFFSWLIVFFVVALGICQAEGGMEHKEKKLGYYKSDAKRGWWWYEDFEKREEEKKEERKDVKREEPKREEMRADEQRRDEDVIKPLYEYSYEELLRMPVDKFRKILEYYENLAVSNPTEENLYYYYNILDVARKKALLFTMQAMYVWQKYPELSTARDYPVVVPGIQAKYEAIREEINSYLVGRRNDYGLVVFVSSRCPYCRVQLVAIREFVNYYGWEVKVVDIDYDRRAVSRFGIEVVPSIILVSKRTGEWFPLSSGVVTVDEIKERLYLAIRNLEGDILPERWGLYKFQEGTSLDPLKPSPLWDKNNKNKPKEGLQRLKKEARNS